MTPKPKAVRTALALAVSLFAGYSVSQAKNFIVFTYFLVSIRVLYSLLSKRSSFFSGFYDIYDHRMSFRIKALDSPGIFYFVMVDTSG